MSAKTVKTKNQLYVYINGKLAYKRWYRPNGEKQASRIFNDAWPDVVLP